VPQLHDPVGNLLWVHSDHTADHDASRAIGPCHVAPEGFWPVYGAFRIAEHIVRRAIWNAWSAQWDLIEYAGRCVRCHRRTYRVSNGETDPRGIIDVASSCPVNPREHGVADAPDIEVPACWACGNGSSDGYAQLIGLATEEARLRAVSGPAGAWHK
jgi:hypothetical protein